MYFLYIYCLGQQAPDLHCCPFGYIIGNPVINSFTVLLQIKSVVNSFCAYIDTITSAVKACIRMILQIDHHGNGILAQFVLQYQKI